MGHIVRLTVGDHKTIGPGRRASLFDPRYGAADLASTGPATSNRAEEWCRAKWLGRCGRARGGRRPR